MICSNGSVNDENRQLILREQDDFYFDATKNKNCETVSENRVDLSSPQGYCMNIQ
ncbi:hypothetical protein HB48_003856 [Salmonella enterica subsp. enterica]|nr:hypothetical protein [Salmonella enterica subsp. enterica serovar Farmsen]EDW1410180.1 hypothetical protein [Salmonella enterica subsp. enterica serovar Farmsen]